MLILAGVCVETGFWLFGIGAVPPRASGMEVSSQSKIDSDSRQEIKKSTNHEGHEEHEVKNLSRFLFPTFLRALRDLRGAFFPLHCPHWHSGKLAAPGFLAANFFGRGAPGAFRHRVRSPPANCTLRGPGTGFSHPSASTGPCRLPVPAESRCRDSGWTVPTASALREACRPDRAPEPRSR